MNRPSGPSLGFICNTCRNAVRRRPAPQLRQFSSTRQLDARALPVFKPTSSSELDTLLSTIRTKYFLPHYLNEKQRKLIQSNKMKSSLENDPVLVSFGDEELRLEHIDITKDVPRRAVFLDVIAAFKDSNDWSNLPGLLEGYHRSKVTLSPQWLDKMIVRANEDGQLGVVIGQCLAQVEKNGFTLKTPIVRERILLEIRKNAREDQWSANATRESLKNARVVTTHMEHPEHCGSRTVGEQDARAEPYVIAVLLELAAHRAQKAYNGEDKKGEVETYSTRLLAALAQQKTQLSGNEAWQVPKDVIKPIQSKQSLVAIDWLVAKFTPVRNALKLALEIRGESWPEDERGFAVYLLNQVEEKLKIAEAEITKHANSTASELATPGLDELRQL